MITLIARIIAKPGKEALLAEECIKIARIVREQEKGCLMYIPYVSANNPAEITFFEKYADQDAADAHVQTPYFKQYRENCRELVAERLPIQFLKELG
jgi:quinol monooxygenase YgiN